ncbi:hypothetical protein J2S03_002123 [Alicyclobacillus cycloheptanicus]|uniref:Uncharacterized protein n=1 Tax=Alicyclobacillus cycloheptanicus TaxID=1457 RepID=A0ABT9XIW7_9BACL|nr:hypothetical protein [Alicyclobacillus cycloheptanicus]
MFCDAPEETLELLRGYAFLLALLVPLQEHLYRRSLRCLAASSIDEDGTPRSIVSCNNGCSVNESMMR